MLARLRERVTAWRQRRAERKRKELLAKRLWQLHVRRATGERYLNMHGAR